MVAIEELQVGDRVKIVDEWVDESGEQAWDGSMDHWLGQIMTVREIYLKPTFMKSYVKMEEDIEEYEGCGWFWHPKLLDCKVNTIYETFEPPCLDELF